MCSDKMSASLVLAELVAIQEELCQETQRYAQRDGANQAYLDRRNDMLGRLWDAVDFLQSVRYLMVWSVVEDQMTKMLAIDPSLDSAILNISLKPHPCHPMFIPVDLSYYP